VKVCEGVTILGDYDTGAATFAVGRKDCNGRARNAFDRFDAGFFGRENFWVGFRGGGWKMARGPQQETKGNGHQLRIADCGLRIKFGTPQSEIPNPQFNDLSTHVT